MQRLAYIIILTLCATILCSCDNYRDDNGDLGGMWQLTMWQTRSTTNQIDSVVATNETGIYYSINRRIIEFKYMKENINEYGDRVFGSFRHTPDSLILFNFTYTAPKDSVPSDKVLRKYGIPEDGAFRINTLSSKRMVLSNTDNVLTFRKY